MRDVKEKHTRRARIRVDISEALRAWLSTRLLICNLLEIGLVELLERLPGTKSDVSLNLLARYVHVLLGAGDLEDRLLLARRRKDISLRVLLHLANGGTLRTDHQTDDFVGHAYLPMQ